MENLYDVPFNWIHSCEIIVLALEMLVTNQKNVLLFQICVILLKLMDEQL